MSDVDAEYAAIPEDYDGAIPTETDNGKRPEDPDITLSQDSKEVYTDADE
jgi:hypothetical protein